MDALALANTARKRRNCLMFCVLTLCHENVLVLEVSLGKYLSALPVGRGRRRERKGKGEGKGNVTFKSDCR